MHKSAADEYNSKSLDHILLLLRDCFKVADLIDAVHDDVQGSSLLDICLGQDDSTQNAEADEGEE